MIKNVVFDVGGVLVRWEPQKVIANVFPESLFSEALTRKFFQSKTTYNLNLGKLTEQEAIPLYRDELKVDEERLIYLIQALKESLLPVEGSFSLLEQLHQAGIPLYCITDNVKEIVTYLHQQYDFLTKFKHVVVSADIGIMKPDKGIYEHLLAENRLIAEECVFIDDVLVNVEGARRVGMQGFQFTDVERCMKKLKALGLKF